jgi:hypothetical protein
MFATFRIITATLTAFLLFACGGGGGGSSDSGSTPPPENVIKIDSTTLRAISHGDASVFDLNGAYETYDWDGVTVIDSVDIDTTVEQSYFSTGQSENGIPILSLKSALGSGESTVSLVQQNSDGAWVDYVADTENGYVYFNDSTDTAGILFIPSPLTANESLVFQFTQRSADGTIEYKGSRTITVGNIEQISTSIGPVETFLVTVIDAVEEVGFLARERTTSNYTYWIHPSIGILKLDGVDTEYYGTNDSPVSSISGTATIRSTNVPIP